MCKILVPVDGSEESEKAVEQAVRLAKLEPGSLIFFYVVNIQQAAISVHLCQEIIDSLTEEGNRILGEIKEGLPEGLTCETVLDVGIPYEKIVDYATDNAVDLIVMGSRGLSLVEGILMGSVSRNVLEQAPCSVLIAK
ncbi:universal stress protein [Anaerovibrio sp. JC8]|uniref:universal stress protein n=1 Tax=Anaerovibrio sp. JC8 TaxID=1240085 RepID=UPI000A0E58C8|nr:universal stress protein [Anaerovibrio sp. JC8]ORU00008.1 universal stress protein [Anaerovibrio sp. JC8]